MKNEVERERVYAKYLLLIKKLTRSHIKNKAHESLLEDVSQEVFFKLLKGDKFSKFDLDQPEEARLAVGYIRRVIGHCYIDALVDSGVISKIRKSGKTIYDTILPASMSDDERPTPEVAALGENNPLNYAELESAYNRISSCFEQAISRIKVEARKRFLAAAFWESCSYQLPLKDLALIFDYQSSNPTQELGRFTETVAQCTQAFGISIVNLGEQVQFLKDYIDEHGEN